MRRRFEVEITELATDGTAAGLGATVVRGWEVVHACEAPPLSARRIVLTHMSAAMLARLADTETPAAYDGMTVDL